MANYKIVKMKHSEIALLLRVLEDKRDEGSYFGRKDYYFRKLNDIIANLKKRRSKKAPQ